MAGTKLPPPEAVQCENCKHDRSEHWMANVADGPFVGKYFLVCPIAVFRKKDYDVDGMTYKQKAKQ